VALSELRLLATVNHWHAVVLSVEKSSGKTSHSRPERSFFPPKKDDQGGYINDPTTKRAASHPQNEKGLI
jgi:hypothetical protein